MFWGGLGCFGVVWGDSMDPLFECWPIRNLISSYEKKVTIFFFMVHQAWLNAREAQCLSG